MLIIVDGYNVTMADPALVDRSKEVQRDALVARVRVLLTSLAGRGGSAVVVFDARGASGASTQNQGPVRVVFADSADDEIVRRCESTSGRVAVYTNDMRLRARISQDVSRRVEYRDISALFTRAARPAAPSRRGSLVHEDGLPAGAKAITEELGEIWLTDDEE